MEHIERQTKTKVLANQVLQFLEKRATEFDAHRDQVLEALIFQAQKDLQSEKNKITNVHKIVSEMWGDIEDKRKKISEILDNQHPITSRMGLIEVIAENLSTSIENHLKFNAPIDPDDFSDTGNVSEVRETLIQQVKPKDKSVHEYLKIYQTNVPNTSKSLENKIPTSQLEHLIPSTQREMIKQYTSLHYWDFGVRASKYLKPDDIVYILTGETLYKGRLLTIIEDESGKIGDVIGWARQFEQPWKNVAALMNVEKLDQVPQELKPFINGVKSSLQKNFYKVK